ncbi:MAG: UDP-N-acetylmuramoyl-L-alanine--D-glutamate ligase [Anaerolineales bacterium]|nr:UDP-N-acetylmuramoyl-L-alanine--D-glutamate ligase [Anaerolineales bacterium]
MDDWRGRKAVILGLARQGKALARYLAGKGAEVVLSDIKPAEALRSELEELADLQLTYALGGHPAEMLEGTDMLFLSGGVPADLPLVNQAHAAGIPVANDAQLFLERTQATVIGITGSAGKTTTTSLVAEMGRIGFEEPGRRVWLGGNIGYPLIAALDDMQRGDLAVMELSSFQLELMTRSPQIAAVLNLRPDHLDRHGEMASYRRAKARILRFQKKDHTALLSCSDPSTWELRSLVRGRLLAFGRDLPEGHEGGLIEDGELRLRIADEEKVICASEQVSMRGPHNRLNVLAASVLAFTAGVPLDAIRHVACTFKGVPHRLELVRRVRGADWYNDSIATTPDRSIAAIESFEQPLVLLAGGRDKNLDWSDFAEIVQKRVKLVVLFGEAAGKIEQSIDDARAPESRTAIRRVPDLQSAVDLAAELAREGDVVLLSPGGTSFDEFKNYEARGEQFRRMVKAI